ncbi:hypothetical protein Fcan01_08158 [Folsomia candida]|uniref:Uncharacterized protein n=1 Tax=Folsomia candida TaxID=158441 RepID=A0A226EPE5_FOLCA|nr:hypothetical protein Fcan01_08158 [Folsomia candida]
MASAYQLQGHLKNFTFLWNYGFAMHIQFFSRPLVYLSSHQLAVPDVYMASRLWLTASGLAASSPLLGTLLSNTTTFGLGGGAAAVVKSKVSTALAEVPGELSAEPFSPGLSIPHELCT